MIGPVLFDCNEAVMISPAANRIVFNATTCRQTCLSKVLLAEQSTTIGLQEKVDLDR
jgi:hypothetical protein